MSEEQAVRDFNALLERVRNLRSEMVAYPSKRKVIQSKLNRTRAHMAVLAQKLPTTHGWSER